MFRLPKDTEITLPLLQEFLDQHRQEVDDRFKRLQAAYESDHDILHMPAKPKWKPDNRIVVNFPKFITDTMDGFFIGNPIKVTSDDAAVSDFVEYLDQYNDQDDNNAELSKICSIHGSGFEMYYTDEESQLCITYLSPLEAFMVYDDSIVERPMYFVRRYTDREGIERGSISNRYGVRYFQTTGGLKWMDNEKADSSGWAPHYFDGVPATEYQENAERQGIFEPVMSEVDAYNKAISEKANDVDYFADAYLKVLGVEVDNDDIRCIRNNRIVNFSGEDSAEKVLVEFMDKPNNDANQENLLNRLERHIFNISMVANISDENFGASSGIALRYKLQAMSNLAKTKARKFTSGMNRRYQLLFSHPASKVPKDAWLTLHYQFSPNFPANLLEEAQIAAQMEGITSHATQLKVISAVDNVQDELDKIQEENKPPKTDPVTAMVFGDEEGTESASNSSGGLAEVQGKALNGAQTQSLLAIMSQFASQSLPGGSSPGSALFGAAWKGRI